MPDKAIKETIDLEFEVVKEGLSMKSNTPCPFDENREVNIGGKACRQCKHYCAMDIDLKILKCGNATGGKVDFDHLDRKKESVNESLGDLLDILKEFGGSAGTLDISKEKAERLDSLLTKEDLSSSEKLEIMEIVELSKPLSFEEFVKAQKSGECPCPKCVAKREGREVSTKDIIEDIVDINITAVKDISESEKLDIVKVTKAIIAGLTEAYLKES